MERRIIHISKQKGFNKYKICGDYTEIYIIRKNNDKYITIIDTEDLPKIIEKNYSWHANFEHGSFYARAVYYEGEIGHKKNKNIKLHQLILEINNINAKGKHIDHINHNTLDNRKQNLRVAEVDNNSAHRKGANSNSKTGVRNVNYIERSDEYWVQLMRKGERYKWIFPSNQFEEAVKFAEMKRQELFGDYAGNG